MDLNEIVDQIKYQAKMMIIGDFDGRIGCLDVAIVGGLGKGLINENRRSLRPTQECVIKNTMFQHKDSCKCMWEEPIRNLQSITDLLIMKKYGKVIKTGNNLIRSKPVSKGLKQECDMSSTLYLLATSFTQYRKCAGVRMGGQDSSHSLFYRQPDDHHSDQEDMNTCLENLTRSIESGD